MNSLMKFNTQFHLTNPYYVIKFFVVEDNDALSKGSEAPEAFSLVYWSISNYIKLILNFLFYLHTLIL
jgi:hypothetical protein